MPIEFNDLDTYLSLNVSELADTTLCCPLCGRQHRVPFQKIEIGDGLVDSIPPLIVDLVGHEPQKLTLIYDRAIEEIIHDAVINKLPGLNFQFIGLGRKNFLLDSDSVLGDQISCQLDSGTDMIIGAGSGVISDLTKWIATKAGKPFILYGTAPSMNAHTSITSTMTINGIKTSSLLNPAKAVLFDVPVLASAPKKMLLAGLGDLSARTICNADWKLAQLIRNKSFCPVPYRLTGVYEPAFLEASPAIGRGETSAVQLLGDAILISGISMTLMDGETSPSSGSEHVFSHYWDLQVAMENAPKNLHGIQVGVGTKLSYALFETMKELEITQIKPEHLLRRRQPPEKLFEENRRRYGSKAYLFDEVVRQKWISDQDFTLYLHTILENWEEIWSAVIPYMGNIKYIQQSMENAGFEFSLDLIRRTYQQAKDALIFGNRYRSRYTLLDLAWELGVLPDAADEILDRAGLA